MTQRSPTALIVDDDPGVRDVLTAILKRDGWRVDAVADGEQALNCLDRTSYAVVVLDLMMPRISGQEVIAEIRKRKIDTRVIVISAVSSAEGSTLDPSIVTVSMQKPIELGDLRAVVRAIKRSHVETP